MAVSPLCWPAAMPPAASFFARADPSRRRLKAVSRLMAEGEAVDADVAPAAAAASGLTRSASDGESGAREAGCICCRSISMG